MDLFVRYKVIYSEPEDEYGIARKHAAGITVQCDCNILQSIARIDVPSDWSMTGLENCSVRNPMGFKSFRRYINELEAAYAAEYNELVERVKNQITE